jgi:hypothetical protein
VRLSKADAKTLGSKPEHRILERRNLEAAGNQARTSRFWQGPRQLAKGIDAEESNFALLLSVRRDFAPAITAYGHGCRSRC